MITQEQFDAICAYVRKRLEKEEKFTIHHSHFQRRFHLKRPYYQEMIRLAREQKVDFQFQCEPPNYVMGSKDCAETIVFYRLE